MYRSLLVKNCKFISTKGLILKSNVLPVTSQMLLHTSPYLKNNHNVNESEIKSFNQRSRHEKQKTFDSEPNWNYNRARKAKIFSFITICGALYFVSPYKLTLSKKEKVEKVTEMKEEESVKDLDITEQTPKNDNVETSQQEINKEVDQELKALEEVDTEKFAETEEEVNQEGAYNEETGEINWDCPCLGGMADGPCGEEFKEAFACFVYSEADPKGIDCVEKFQNMQNCFRKYPEHYADQLKDEEEVNEKIIKENEQKGIAADATGESAGGEIVDVSLESSPETNGEEAIKSDQESTPDISKEEPVFVEDVPEVTPESNEDDISDLMEDVELTENS